MSWRSESTFKPTSKLNDDEKEYLKLAKKVRDILKLEEKIAAGEKLEGLQLEKVKSKDKLLKEVASLATKLPHDTELLDKNPDITDLLPSSAMQGIEKQRKKDLQQRERRAEQDEKKKEVVEFVTRHDRAIVNLALSADGRHLFTCSKDSFVLCWPLSARWLQPVSTFAGHRGAVFALDVRSGAYGVASGGADEIINFWQADPTKLKEGSVQSPTACLKHGGIIKVLRWCPFDESNPRLASASEKLVSKPPAICVWRIGAKGKAEQIVQYDDPKVLPGKANDLQWGGGSKIKLFSCHDNGYVGVWSADEPRLMKTIKVHAEPVSALRLSTDGSTLVTASRDSTAVAIDVTTPSTDIVMTYKTNRPLNALCLSEDYKAGEEGGGTVVLAGGKNTRDVTTSSTLEDEFESKIMDAVSGEEFVSTEKTHFGPVHVLVAMYGHKKRNAYASVSEDGCVKVHGWDGSLLHSDVRTDVMD